MLIKILGRINDICTYKAREVDHAKITHCETNIKWANLDAWVSTLQNIHYYGQLLW